MLFSFCQVFKNPNVLIHENKISNKNVVKHILGPNAYVRGFALKNKNFKLISKFNDIFFSLSETTFIDYYRGCWNGSGRISSSKPCVLSKWSNHFPPFLAKLKNMKIGEGINIYSNRPKIIIIQMWKLQRDFMSVKEVYRIYRPILINKNFAKMLLLLSLTIVVFRTWWRFVSSSLLNLKKIGRESSKTLPFLQAVG